MRLLLRSGASGELQGALPAMPRYFINCLDDTESGGRKFFIWCEDDEDAVQLARKLHHPHKVEIFRDGALVATLEGARASLWQ